MQENTHPNNILNPSISLPQLDVFASHVIFAEASDLARKGYYQEAKSLLSDITDWQKKAAVLDLLARICAQQGLLKEAQAYWEAALLLDPSNPTYLEGMQYIESRQSPHSRLTLFADPILRGLIVMFGLILIGMLLIRLEVLQQNIANLSSSIALLEATPGVITPAAPADSTALQNTFTVEIDQLRQTLLAEIQSAEASTQDKIGKQISDMEIRQKTLLETQGIQQTLPSIVLDVPGLVTIPKDNRILVQFQNGLFRYSWSLSPDGRNILTQLGRQLEPNANRIHLIVIGRSSRDESKDYFDLGMMRALIVVQYLQSTTQLPAEIFSITPAGDAALPFPEDTPSNRIRNQTVEIWITLK